MYNIENILHEKLSRIYFEQKYEYESIQGVVYERSKDVYVQAKRYKLYKLSQLKLTFFCV